MVQASKNRNFALLFIFGLLATASLWSIVASGQPKEAKNESKIIYRGTFLVQLRVSNLERSIDFYTKVLEFELVKRMDSLKWAELSFGIPNVMVGLGEGEEVKGSGTASLNVGVMDVATTRTLLEERGVKFLGPTIDVPDKVRLADFLDLDGNKIRLVQRIGA